VETALSVIGGKWKPLILWHLFEEGTCRFLELQRLLPGVTRKMLTQHLRELDRDGIVARKVLNQRPLHVEYSVTEYGSTLRPVLKGLCDWGSAHEGHVARNGAKKPIASPVPKRPPPRLIPAIG
jgi:DNA-binding HxlR family transcriptional regulator